jgi:3-isopropylmalate dehydrogenase
MTRAYKIAVLKGDGIGPEVVESAREVLLSAASKNTLKLDLIDLPIGLDAYRKFGRTFPPDTSNAMKDCDGWILGPLQSPYPVDDKDYPMASGKIRKGFDLYANIRPITSLVGGKTIDYVIVRENTEDFYPDRNLFKGYGEFWPNEDTVISLRVITRKACRRIASTAFRLARSRNSKRLVTAVHKANVLIEGDGLFLSEVRKVREESFPDVLLEDRLADSAAMDVVTNPGKFDVIVTTNLFGDILSDVAASQVGGLGLAPSLNSGDRQAMAQAVHGSAPDIAGRGIANPVAEILSTAMLLQWLGSRYDDKSLSEAANAITKAVSSQLSDGRKEQITQDLGGTASTGDFTKGLIARL